MKRVKASYAAAHFDEVCELALEHPEGVVIGRGRGKNVVIMSAAELSAMNTTIHLLSSPENARRLFDALERAQRGEGRVMTVEELRREIFSESPFADES